jgi:poly(hydroxyalkanoate) granule-associated protein
MPRTMKPARKLPAVGESAHQIWLAGLGAMALAQEEGGKVFHTLVKKGHGVEKENKAMVGKVLARVEDLRTDAGHRLERVVEPLDEGLTAALHRLGIPTRKEIATLTRRVEELTRTVEKATARRPAPGRKIRRPARARKVTPVLVGA